MHFIQILSAAAAIIGCTSAAPAETRDHADPTDDGFPNPSDAQLASIETIAGGQLSNAAPPATLAAGTLTGFQLIAFNENFEVGFFSSLIDNITNNVDGFQLDSEEATELLSALKAVKAQEELHALAAEGVLTHFGAFAPPPCTYNFPTTDVKSAIALAETFTALVLGTLQAASQAFAAAGDSGPVRTVASVIGQEGEQTGFYRGLLGLQPSSKPFLTTSTPAFAYSALQGFVASCPFDVSEIPIPVLPALTVVSGSGGADVAAQDQSLQFTADLSAGAPCEGWESYVGGSGDGLYVTYLTGQNVPVSEPITDVSWDGNVISFCAFFPYSANVMDGFSIAALTVGGSFASADDIPADTLAAPGLIQVNTQLFNSLFD